jgi:hypothetical protein
MNNLYQIYQNFEKNKFPDCTSLTCKDISKKCFLVFLTKVGKINIFSFNCIVYKKAGVLNLFEIKRVVQNSTNYIPLTKHPH